MQSTVKPISIIAVLLSRPLVNKLSGCRVSAVNITMLATKIVLISHFSILLSYHPFLPSRAIKFLHISTFNLTALHYDFNNYVWE